MLGKDAPERWCATTASGPGTAAMSVSTIPQPAGLPGPSRPVTRPGGNVAFRSADALTSVLTARCARRRDDLALAAWRTRGWTDRPPDRAAVRPEAQGDHRWHHHLPARS